METFFNASLAASRVTAVGDNKRWDARVSADTCPSVRPQAHIDYFLTPEQRHIRLKCLLSILPFGGMKIKLKILYL